MSEVLRMRGVSREFGRPVLREVDLSVHTGEIAVLVGGSGSGKTTLLRIAAGLERVGAGQVELRGQLVDDGRRAFVPSERRRVGMVFQEHALWSHLTVHDNISLALPRGEPASRTEELLEAVELGGFGKRPPATLSGGQQQRVALARALATRSDLLLLDEPLSSLDAPVRERLRPLIRDMVRKEGRSALFVSHDRLDAWHLADRILVLEEGRLVQDDLPVRLHAVPATENVARIMGAAGNLAVLGLGPGRVAAGADVLQTVHSTLAPGQPAIALAHPAAVRIEADGLAARRIDLVFEAGWWRTRWQTGVGELVGLYPTPPPETAFLAIVPDALFVFPR
jgi:iron(III) transport system ATP-binding protein